MVSNMERLNEELVNAAINGQHKTVIDLLKNPKVDPKWEKSLALNMAARYGHAQCVQALVGVSNPMDDNLYAIEQAVSYGHLECVEILWPHLTLTDNQIQEIISRVLMDISKAGKTLLFVWDHSDLTMDDEQYFLNLFAQNVFKTHDDILAVGRYFDIINNTNILDFCARYNQEAFQNILTIREQHHADTQKTVLLHSLNTAPTVASKKKM